MSNPRLEEIITRALTRRKSILSPQTNMVRLIDGSGDGVRGNVVEQFGEAWLVSTTGAHLDRELSDQLARQGRPLYWKRLDQHEKQAPQHLSGPELPENFIGLENGIRCQLSFQSGYSQGIFIDQRENRARLRELVKPGQKVLNTFSYTGVFSVAAALAGGITTTLDLSQVYLDWARENFKLNELDPEEHYFCKGDTFHWLRRFAKQGRRFDFIILDPPTFSRDEKGKVFRVEKDFGSLFSLALDCLAPDGQILACTNFRGLRESEFLAQLRSATTKKLDLSAAAMPPDFTDRPYLKSVWAQKSG